MKTIELLFICSAILSLAKSRKKKSEYTQKDWDRIAREWEREEMEEDERERQEELKRNPGMQFNPNDIGKIDPEKLMAQAKRGKPTMVFFNVREEYCSSDKQLAKMTSNWAALLLNGNIQVQNYPVATNRAIFMVQDGSASYEVKNFLLKQKEIESVTIDQQHWDANGDGKPTYPGEDKVKPKKSKENSKTSGAKKNSDNMTNKQEIKLKKEEKKREEIKNTVNIEDEISDEEFNEKLLKEVDADSKSPKPMSEDQRSNEIPDLTAQKTASSNDIKSEL